MAIYEQDLSDQIKIMYDKLNSLYQKAASRPAVYAPNYFTSTNTISYGTGGFTMSEVKMNAPVTVQVANDSALIDIWVQASALNCALTVGFTLNKSETFGRDVVVPVLPANASIWYNSTPNSFETPNSIRRVVSGLTPGLYYVQLYSKKVDLGSPTQATIQARSIITRTI